MTCYIATLPTGARVGTCCTLMPHGMLQYATAAVFGVLLITETVNNFMLTAVTDSKSVSKVVKVGLFKVFKACLQRISRRAGR